MHKAALAGAGALLFACAIVAHGQIERGIELKSSPSPEDFAGYLKAEIEKTGKLVREQNMRLEQ